VKQFILESEPDKDNTIHLIGKDYRYLVRVRRLAAGEYFTALLPNGKETQVQIVSVNKDTLVGKCTPSSSYEKSSFVPPIILFQALPKADKMDLIVRQAAEGGITEIVPFVSEFSVAKNSASRQKFIRWERIIKEARQQSGSKTATSLQLSASGECFSVADLCKYWEKLKEEGALGLLFHHESTSAGGLEHKSLHRYLSINLKTAAAAPVVFAVGPEGGFSDREVSFFLENGFKPITIGDTVLRTETAALYCAAAIRIILLEKNSWELK